MFKRSLILIFIAFILAPAIVSSSQKGRTALLIDTKDSKSELTVTGIEPFYKQKFLIKPPWGSVYVITPYIEFGLPIDSVASIEKTDQTWHDGISYHEKIPIYSIKFKSKKTIKEVKGSLRDFQADSSKNTLLGNTDFGTIEINMNNIKRLIFNEPPQLDLYEMLSQERFDTMLTFKDGTTIPVSSVHIHDREYSTKGYVIGGEYVNNQMNFLPLIKGETTQKIPFEKIKKIELGEPKNISIVPCTVTSKDGKRMDGQLEKVFEFVGFTGFCEQGPFFININKVKKIDFSSQ